MNTLKFYVEKIYKMTRNKHQITTEPNVYEFEEITNPVTFIRRELNDNPEPVILVE